MAQHEDPVVPGEVIVGCDGSPQAMAAVEWAAAEAARRGARLHIVLANPIEYLGLAGPAGLGSGLGTRRVGKGAALLETHARCRAGPDTRSVLERVDQWLAGLPDLGLPPLGT